MNKIVNSQKIKKLNKMNKIVNSKKINKLNKMNNYKT